MRFPNGGSFVRSLFELCVVAWGLSAIAYGQTVGPAQLAGLKWRNIGPFRGGRVSAVTGVIGQPDTFYIGLPEGGVWKSTSAGQTWYPVFDAVRETATVGSLAVAESDPTVVYAGTGDISVSAPGLGAYRSADAGKTWTHVGLEDTTIIPSLLIDPHDPNIVVAAAAGNVYQGSGSRGVFRTKDGGKTWSNTLTKKNDVGIQFLARAHDNPNTIYAIQAWSNMMVRRNPKAGADEPVLYRSVDEGATWSKIEAKGLPTSNGRMTMAVAEGKKAQRLFLLGMFGLYRSDDGGATWRRMAADDSRIANGQGFYSSGVEVDPQNTDIVYTLATCVYRSTDGGNTFDGFKGAPGGDDPQHLWIDPTNGSHMLLGGDQGATVTLDRGRTWGSWYNQATGQLYHVSADNQFPYRVYATQQDSGCVSTGSRGNFGEITPFEWLAQPGNEGGYILPDPLNPNITYTSGLTTGIIKVSYPSGQWVPIDPGMNPSAGLRGGFQMGFSPTDPHEFLVGYQYLASTTDGGARWNKLSPDLTFDPTAAKPKANENGMDRYAAISSFSASPLAGGVIWVGTTNGLVQVTRDHGRSWEIVTPHLTGRRTASVRFIEASGTDAASAYVVVNSNQPGGTASPIYRTHDYGETWSEGTHDIQGGGLAVLCSDRQRPGLLFGLNGRHVVVSFDDGDHWQTLDLNLPYTQLNDLKIHGNDLVLGTFGRAMWILDDYSPLREISATTVNEPAHLFKPALAYRLRRNINQDTPLPPDIPHAENAPLGAIIYYSLAAKPAHDIELDILDERGRVVRHMSSAPIVPYNDPPPTVPSFWVEVRKPLPTEVGLNRINWNVRYDTPPAFVHDPSDVMGAAPYDTPAAIEGPLALPGTYTARLTVDGRSASQKFVVENDPRSPATSRDLRSEHALRMDLYAGAQEAWDGNQQADAEHVALAKILAGNPPADVAKAATALDAKLLELRGAPVFVRRFYGPPSPTNFCGINGDILVQLDTFDYGDMAPTEAAMGLYGDLWLKLHLLTDKWRAIQKKDLADLDALLVKHGLTVIPPPGPPLVDPPQPAKKYLPKPQPADKPMPAKANG